jgi:hypothetical protein
MSTKGLMAHKKVKEVTLNDAGKAATLTLADGWTYEGSAGPFTLTNVEHGHTIVKNAVGAGGTTSTPRAPKSATSAQRSASEPELNDRGELMHGAKKPLQLDRPTEPRGDTIFVYRMMLVPKEGSAAKEERAGWLKTSREYSTKEQAEWAWNNLARSHKPHVTAETHVARTFRWTNKHQAAARKDGVLGSPWGGENHG